MKINNITEAFKGKKEFIETQERLFLQLTSLLQIKTRPDLSKFASDGLTEIEQLRQLVRMYDKEFHGITVNLGKANELLHKIQINFKEYRPSMSTELREAEKFVETIKELLTEVEA